MRLPVLVSLPHQEPLIESALAASQRRAPTIPFQRARAPAGLEIDFSAPAVPVGATAKPMLTLSDLAPDKSSEFVVRAFMEVEEPAEIPHELDGQPLFSDPVIAPFITCGGSPPVGNVNDVRQKLNTTNLSKRRLTGRNVAIAIMDTGINLNHLTLQLGGQAPRFDAANSWVAPGQQTTPGRHPVDHGTMCAFDALIAAPEATLLDFAILAGTAPGGSLAGRTLSVALLALAQLIATWRVAFAPGGAQRYAALVVNNSWGIFHPSWDFLPGHPGRYIDNPNHPFNRITQVLAQTGADILYAAGNCGSACPDGRCQGRTTGTIMGTNASAEVLTVAGCDVNDIRVGYSSQGPSIAGMHNEKPDVTAYTHFLGSQAFGQGSPDSGTSAACPVAAGCVAAIRTKANPMKVPPANLFAQIRAAARQPSGAGGWDPDYGYGIIDADAAAKTLGI